MSSVVAKSQAPLSTLSRLVISAVSVIVQTAAINSNVSDHGWHVAHEVIRQVFLMSLRSFLDIPCCCHYPRNVPMIRNLHRIRLPFPFAVLHHELRQLDSSRHSDSHGLRSSFISVSINRTNLRRRGHISVPPTSYNKDLRTHQPQMHLLLFQYRQHRHQGLYHCAVLPKILLWRAKMRTSAKPHQ